MGFDRGCTRAAVEESAPSLETGITRSSLTGNSLSVQVASCILAQLVAQEGQRPVPDSAPRPRTGVAPAAWAQGPILGGVDVSDPDLERHLVFKCLGTASRGGADVRLDLRAPFWAQAWPCSGLQTSLWTWSIGHGFQCKEPARINELEVGAAVNAVKWRASGVEVPMPLPQLARLAGWRQCHG
ncbi:unnamed protein product [Prorocentrum cordatum]|uniref:Subtilisin n=1 Tax=Prorocentrum cordatum TaxID=2364126 RepID=A0ABN9P8P6_9DINO|nr:unnamed protein product [Polarella glacialis]